jgi:hypothetical protein
MSASAHLIDGVSQLIQQAIDSFVLIRGCGLERRLLHTGIELRDASRYVAQGFEMRLVWSSIGYVASGADQTCNVAIESCSLALQDLHHRWIGAYFGSSATRIDNAMHLRIGTLQELVQANCGSWLNLFHVTQVLQSYAYIAIQSCLLIASMSLPI